MGCGGSVGKSYEVLEPDVQTKSPNTASASSSRGHSNTSQSTQASPSSSSRMPPPLPPLPKVEPSGAVNHVTVARQPHSGMQGRQPSNMISRDDSAVDSLRVDLQFFEQLEVLDETPMSMVVRLRHRQTGVLSAGKRVKKGGQVCISGDHLNEVRMLQKLAQVDGVVGLQGVCDSGLEFWTVMELCAGGRLEPWLQQAPESARGLARDLFGTVKLLHAMLICHLDLKPDNVLLTSAGKTKLCDFVTSCQLNTADQQLVGNCGTQGFKAPEITSSKSYSGLSADVFSLGRTLQVMLTFSPQWHEASKVAQEMTSVDPQRRPSVATSCASLFGNANEKRGDVMLDFDALDTVSSREVAVVGAHGSRARQNFAEPPAVKSRWDKSGQARARALSVEDPEIAQRKSEKQMRFKEQSQPPKPQPKSSFAPDAFAKLGPKGAAPKHSPVCGTVTCTRVGVCLCNDKVAATLVHCHPSQRPGAKPGLRRCSTP